jgi:hypothetical protein
MINLLPPEEKKKLLREYWMRFGVIVLWAIFALEVFTVAVLTPSYYSLYLNTRGLAQSLAERRALTPEGAKEALENLAAIKQQMALLKVSDATIDAPPSLVLGEIIEQKPQGIEIFGFTYSRTAKSAIVQVSGTAQTQEAMLAFRRNVKTNPRVSDFKYGSNFITQKTNIDFTASINFQ